MAEGPKAIVQRFMDEVWSGGQPAAAAAAVLAPDLIWHHPTLGPSRGREAAVAAIEEMRAAFPDLKLSVNAMLAEGDQVMTWWTATGAHRHPYRGAAPSGRQVVWDGVVLNRVVDGRIVEHRAFVDTTVEGNPHAILTR